MEQQNRIKERHAALAKELPISPRRAQLELALKEKRAELERMIKENQRRVKVSLCEHTSLALVFLNAIRCVCELKPWLSLRYTSDLP